MSEFHVRKVTIETIDQHPNADRLEIVKVDGYPVITGKGNFAVGDKAIYIPVDSIVPDNEEFADVFKYTKKGRVRAAKLRGVLSMGVLHPLPAGVDDADDWATVLGITKYEEPIEIITHGKTRPNDPRMPLYDLEGLRHYPFVIQPMETVIVTEKLHGTNARFGLIDGQFLIGSRRTVLEPDGDNVWCRVAREYGMEQKLCAICGRLDAEYILYGEIVGQGVQDLDYGYRNGELGFYLFDALNVKTGQFEPFNVLRTIALVLGLNLVPVLYQGPYNEQLIYELAEGSSLLGGHVREGVVVKPVHERWDYRIGRVCLKIAGEGYLTRKEAA